MNTKNKYGSTALMLASARGDEEIVKQLLAVKEIKVNTKDEFCWTALDIAKIYRNQVVVDLIENWLKRQGSSFTERL